MVTHTPNSLFHCFSKLLILLSPIIPHFAEEIWERLNVSDAYLSKQSWPVADESLLVDDTVTIAIQINGKLKATIQIPKDTSKQETEETALKDPTVQKAIEGKEIRKIIVVPNRIVNVVA